MAPLSTDVRWRSSFEDLCLFPERCSVLQGPDRLRGFGRYSAREKQPPNVPSANHCQSRKPRLPDCFAYARYFITVSDVPPVLLRSVFANYWAVTSRTSRASSAATSIK